MFDLHVVLLLFIGILPKDKPRAQTVRDVKKRESERRGREFVRKRDMTDDLSGTFMPYKDTR